ncbi:MAG TPA: DUF1569 domain-containing protein [Gemmataceae bacterium]
MSEPKAAVNTKAVSERREVRLDTYEDLLAEVDRVVAAEREGRLRALGNWTPGQIFQHLGRWIEFAIDGFPFRYPWWVRVPGRVLTAVSWRWFYKTALKPGFRNPGEAKAVEPEASVSLEEGADYLRRQVRRVLDGEKMQQPSPGGWRLSHGQWEWVQLRHAEMHLSFLHIGGE